MLNFLSQFYRSNADPIALDLAFKIMIPIESIKTKQGPEMAAIILCCRVFFNTASESELAAFIEKEDMNWDVFGSLARQHRIRPTVYKVISKHEIPKHVKDAIRSEHTLVTMQALGHAVETERIIELLNTKGIEARPYKGMAYSVQFFGDLVSRESSDIDLIIKPEALPHVLDILKADGYLPELEDVYNYLGPRYQRYYKDLNFNKYDKGERLFHVEIHWAIAENFIIARHNAEFPVYDSGNYIKAVRSQLIALDETTHFKAMVIHHGLKDTFRSLKNIIDLSQAMCHPALQQNSARLRAEINPTIYSKTFSVANALCQNIMGVGLYKQEHTEHDAATSHFLDQVCSMKLLPAEGLTTLKLYIKNRTMLQNNFADRMLYLTTCLRHRFIPTQKDFRLIRLPHSLFFLYYLLKPFRSVISPFDTEEEKEKLIPGK